jgi:periplasmic divalent cation tolerance protein
MKKYCVIKTTFKNLSEAKKMAKILLANKLIACAQISTIESFYSWNNKVINEKEVLLSAKTKVKLYKKAEKIILCNHSYKLPQIICLPILDGSKFYLDWIDSSL